MELNFSVSLVHNSNNFKYIAGYVNLVSRKHPLAVEQRNKT